MNLKEIPVLLHSLQYLTIAKIWKQMSNNRWVDKEYIYTIYDIQLYNGNLAICENMDGLGGCFPKWNRPDTERQILHDFTYLKWSNS